MQSQIVGDASPKRAQQQPKSAGSVYASSGTQRGGAGAGVQSILVGVQGAPPPPPSSGGGAAGPIKNAPVGVGGSVAGPIQSAPVGVGGGVTGAIQSALVGVGGAPPSPPSSTGGAANVYSPGGPQRGGGGGTVHIANVGGGGPPRGGGSEIAVPEQAPPPGAPPPDMPPPYQGSQSPPPTSGGGVPNIYVYVIAPNGQQSGGEVGAMENVGRGIPSSAPPYRPKTGAKSPAGGPKARVAGSKSHTATAAAGSASASERTSGIDPHFMEIFEKLKQMGQGLMVPMEMLEKVFAQLVAGDVATQDEVDRARAELKTKADSKGQVSFPIIQDVFMSVFGPKVAK